MSLITNSIVHKKAKYHSPYSNLANDLYCSEFIVTIIPQDPQIPHSAFFSTNMFYSWARSYITEKFLLKHLLLNVLQLVKVVTNPYTAPTGRYKKPYYPSLMYQSICYSTDRLDSRKEDVRKLQIHVRPLNFWLFLSGREKHSPFFFFLCTACEICPKLN